MGQKNYSHPRVLMSMLILFICSFYFSNISLAQNFRGEVQDQNEVPISGATVYLLYSNSKTITSESGAFEFLQKDIQPPERVVTYYQNLSDTFNISHFDTYWVLKMKGSLELKEVLIQGERSGSFISSLETIKSEVINKAELRKAACCDLAGCFETQSSVQAQTTNILTNAKELRILGLSGVYNQVLIDGMPLIQGLTYTYGISTVPGSIVENIWITKGANSVLQGYESISGQINVITQHGGKSDPLYVNAYINSFGEKHFNVNASIRKTKWNSYLAFHTVQPAAKFDKDNDTFLDLPILTRYMVLNKWRYGSETADGWSAIISLRYTDEKRIGGQVNFNSERDLGKTTNYGQYVKFQQPEAYIHTGYRFDASNKITFITSGFIQNQNSWFGVTHYKASQQNLYANIQYELDWGKSAQHDFKTGISFRHLNLNENISFSSDILPRTYGGNYYKEENIPGIFAENTFKFQDKVTFILGIRADKRNNSGTFITPRSLVRYAPGANTDLRASIGTGWRTVNLFSENINLLTGGRNIIFTEELKPERALNTGVSIVQRASTQNASFTFSADFYHTIFQNQFFPDYDSDPLNAIIANFDGKSVSNGFQVEASCKLIKQWDFKLAYNFLEVYRIVNSTKEDLPFNSNHRLLGVISYSPESRIWQADINMHWYGSQRLPNTKQYPEEFRQPANSKPYSVISAQFTRTFSQLEIYAGCENIFDFRQNRPILSWQNPFGPYFDTSFAWGPTRGREFYIGVRVKLIKEKVE